MMAPVPPSRLLIAARVLIERPDAADSGVWPRAAAVLTRQALEGALNELWAAVANEVAYVSMKAQLLCAASYLGNPVLAGRISFTWAELSQACHHHAYELAPTAGELERWIETTAELVAAVHARATSATLPA